MNNDFINCIDVGSYIGVITLMMSKKLKKSNKKWRIHSFEPFEESFSRLQENINLDPYNKNIIINNLAVSNISGIKTLKTYFDTPGQNHLDHSNLYNEEDASLKKVEVITLRDYLYKNNVKHITICKIDAEGSDELVIKGLYEFLENRDVDYFIFEFQDSLSFKRIKNLLISNDYTFYYMVRNENFLVNSLENYPKNSRSLLNLIAVSPRKKNDFIKEFSLD